MRLLLTFQLSRVVSALLPDTSNAECVGASPLFLFPSFFFIDVHSSVDCEDENFEVKEYVHKGFGGLGIEEDVKSKFVRVAVRGRSWIGTNGVYLVGLRAQVVEEMQMINNCVVGWRTRVMAQVGARALGRGLVKQWHREVCVRMASTALIFSALQPVRPALLLPYRQQVMPGRVGRENCTNLLLLRQCATTEPSYGAANSVLLETRECADGSIMYKFGSAEQKEAMSIANDQLIPKSAESSEVPAAESQSIDSDCEEGDHRQAASEQKVANCGFEQQEENSAKDDVSHHREVPVSNSKSAPSPETIR
ncbi:hypothetical protein R1flu_027723 [Riccia fluitans]|uniref:Uncharacterized protein n=1 Tax=Riccia fluitans TaxID=41844 RepID=A0ABD1XJQ8_9MARC